MKLENTDINFPKILFSSGENNKIITDSPESLSNITLAFTGNNNSVYIGKNLKILGQLTINFNGDNNTINIGDNTYITRIVRMSIFPAGIGAKGDNCSIIIGNNNLFNGDTEFLCGEKNTSIRVSDRCLFATNIKLWTSDNHAIYNLSTKKRVNLAGNIDIGNDVWVCNDVTILNNSSVGNNCVLATKALLSNTSPVKNSILAGIPAKVIKKNIYWTHECKNEFPHDILMSIANSTQSKALSKTGRKWRKLKNNPKAFFEDMFNAKTPINKFTRKILKLKNNPKAFFRDMFKRKNFQSQTDSKNKAPTSTKTHHINQTDFNFQINFNEIIHILPPKTKVPEHLTNIFVYKSLEIDFVNKLFELLESKDSIHLNKKNVTCAELVHCSNTCLEMFEKTSVSIRDTFCKYDNFVLFNPELSICQVIYSLSNTFRIIVIFSDISLFDTKYFDCCDAIIVKTEETLIEPKFKRFFYAKTDEMVALALKKIISEGVPQNPDNLIPLYGIPLLTKETDCNFSSKIYGGIIYIDQSYQITTGTQREQVFAMIPFIKHITVTSSIFNKNLDACLECMKGHDVANFILRTLNDGVLFDVKKI